MIRDITIGQYYPKESGVHQLDPRVKLAGTFVYMISMFCFHRFLGFLFVSLFLGWIIKKSEIPFSYIVKGLKPILFLLVFTMVINALFVDGHIIWSWGILKISVEGIRKAVFMGIRLSLLVLGASMMTFTTTPNHLTDGLEQMLKPLRKLHVPVHEISMMMSIALRFIPILLEETDKIMKAQMARGADFETGGMIKRAKNMVPLLVPLFVSAFRRANDLAMAMEARCYRGGEGRTKMKPLRYQQADYIAYGILIGYIVILMAGLRYIPNLWTIIG
ncbi:MAG: energy-coupling factor transporter transmembrane protein EcfT [Lachnospiraceae bacterium]|nr:energy-coupling factor transporter transmembrane protein EcfT [Lachnospiraceae bacterium]